MVCATVCLTVVPSFSDITDVSTSGHSSKTDRSRTPLFHVAQYGDDIIGRELNLRKLSGRQWETETAVTAVHNDISQNVDRTGQARVLVLLDLSAAFDTVDHKILLDILKHRFGITGLVLKWYQSYLADRTQTFQVGSNRSIAFIIPSSKLSSWSAKFRGLYGGFVGSHREA